MGQQGQAADSAVERSDGRKAELAAAGGVLGAVAAMSCCIMPLVFFALGIGIAARCDGCIAYHVHDALRAGATRKEIVETIGVAIMMGGGPATMYGAQAFEALEQFETQGVR